MPSPRVTAIQPRVLAGITALIVTGLLLLLYFYRRRLYILYWIIGWLVTAVSTFLTAFPYPRQKIGWFAYGISQFLGIISALVFVISADAYREPPAVPARLCLHPDADVPLVRAGAAGARAIGGVRARATCCIAGALARRRRSRTSRWPAQARMLGAAVVGTMLLASATANVWLALWAAARRLAGRDAHRVPQRGVLTS